MKRILDGWTTWAAALCLASTSGCRQNTSQSNQAYDVKPKVTYSQDSASNQEAILVATIPNHAAKSAWAALNKAGIAYGSDGSRATAIRVSRQDASRAKSVLKGDAELHKYKIFFAD